MYLRFYKGSFVLKLKFESGKIWKFVKSAGMEWSKRKRLEQNTGNVRSVCGKSIEGGLKDLRHESIPYFMLLTAYKGVSCS